MVEQKTDTTLAMDLARMLNQHSVENGSNTPDFILARYMLASLNAFEAAVAERDMWYGERRKDAAVRAELSREE